MMIWLCHFIGIWAVAVRRHSSRWRAKCVFCSVSENWRYSGLSANISKLLCSIVYCQCQSRCTRLLLASKSQCRPGKWKLSDVSYVFTYLPPTKEVNVFARVCLSVCLSVWDYSKTHAWIWMKYCVLTDVGTWTNWLTFEPDPDYSPDAGTGLLSQLLYKHCYAKCYVGKIRRIRIGHCSEAWF